MQAHERVAPPRLVLELRDEAGLLVAEQAVETGPLGWDGAATHLDLRLDVPSPPLQFGRFQLRLGLEGDGGRVLHWREDAVRFLVYPDGEERGLVRLEGTWSVATNDSP